MFEPGLKGVTAIETSISHIDGKDGVLQYRGVLAKELIGKYSFEEVSFFLLKGYFPDKKELEHFSQALVKHRFLSEETKKQLELIIPHQSLISAVRSAVSLLDQSNDLWPVNLEEGIQLIAKLPTIVAYIYRKKKGLNEIEPETNFGHAANFLYMLFGEEKSVNEVDALEAYMILTAEHGLNASTFAARVVTSTQSDVYSAVTAAIGTLKGPLHGGAPSGVIQYMKEAEKSSVNETIRKKLTNGEKIMGFGHRVYKTKDPRAEALKIQFNSIDPKPAWADFTLQLEKETVNELQQLKPGRELYANVEFYAAAIMKAIGISNELFTPIFCCNRMVGWVAHIIEQSEHNVIFRPNAHYRPSV
ncbi:citrate/2-methylcitrate synthase [Halobacillus mangrovi]|uniref:Citrate synthase n=1 Tax=Halobacillus mangrovi TaxID=402384 RepID=A0A1W5ZVM6_9BACI|nr:citrate/2-methylcitrate synthase [Halobacillus mangrovi]ARI77354.1 hypothetical protein HM131_11100 [Halobacillus mangrovi]